MSRRFLFVALLLTAIVVTVFRPTGAMLAQSDVTITVFSQTYVREEREPDLTTRAFQLPAYAGPPFTLLVKNGDEAGQHRATSGELLLNGLRLISPRDLGHNISVVERPLSLQALNTIQVRLRGDENSTLRVAVQARLNWRISSLPAIGVDLRFPPSWIIQTPRHPGMITISNKTSLSETSDESLASESVFTLRRLEDVNPTNLPVSVWFDQFFANGFDNPIDSRSSIVVGDRPAVRIEMSEIGSTAHVYIADDGDIVEVAFGVFNESFIPLYELMLQSLVLTR